MFAGHFGLAAAVKARRPELPLWALMLGTQLLDVVFVPLLLTGVETIEPAGGNGYGEAIIHADYTHSLLGALIAAVAGLAAGKAWGRRGGLMLGAVVFSHWSLDLLVHRADMPILPGNWGHLPLLGFGLWAIPWLSTPLEAPLIAAGGLLYFRSALARTRVSGLNASRAWVAGKRHGPAPGPFARNRRARHRRISLLSARGCSFFPLRINKRTVTEWLHLFYMMDLTFFSPPRIKPGRSFLRNKSRQEA
ncbi:hypothetical protein LJK88_49980 [Paenibacillus sp. P26]|nr:hypothetical protein LJK88_49980 [Paenibacillus sp. P26]